MDHLKQSFDSFFDSEARVAVIKGEWGVGKTYFWGKYIKNRINEKKVSQIAYSYISLFGKSSLEDVRKSIFHRAEAICSDQLIEKTFGEQFEKSRALFDKSPWLTKNFAKARNKTSRLNWLSKLLQDIPFFEKYSNIINSLEFGLVQNYVICFDDLERKGEGLSVKEVMGLVDELAQRKNCKVILIFNRNSFENGGADKEQFDTYREKVVDIELTHNPTCKENFNCVFSIEADDYFPIIEKAVHELNIKNIRVLKKLKYMIETFSRYFEKKGDQIKIVFLMHAVILGYGFYIRDKELNYELLKELLSKKSWLSFVGSKDSEMSKGEKKFRTIASNLKLSPSDLDQSIIFFLEHGYIDSDQVNLHPHSGWPQEAPSKGAFT
ncbi:MAG: KAP family NTPase [Desulfobacterales bacterium]|nr:KAP family NTPase [Desulfobacterales bacterium]